MRVTCLRYNKCQTSFLLLVIDEFANRSYSCVCVFNSFVVHGNRTDKRIRLDILQSTAKFVSTVVYFGERFHLRSEKSAVEGRNPGHTDSKVELSVRNEEGNGGQNASFDFMTAPKLIAISSSGEHALSDPLNFIGIRSR